MSMSEKDFIALADVIKAQTARELAYPGAVQRPFTFGQIQELADFCQSRNSNFNRLRWLAHIAGECGSSGGRIPSHPKHGAGLCPVCRHYGEDCTGKDAVAGKQATR